MRIDRTQLKWIAAMVVIVVVFVAAVWWPGMCRVRQLSDQIDKAQQTLISTRGKTRSLPAMKSRVQQIRDELDQASQIIPNEDEQAELIRQLGKQIKKLNLEDRSISTKLVETKQQYSVLPIRITFCGDSISVMQLVERVEKMPRLVSLTKLRLESAEGDSPKVDTEIEMQSFFYARKDLSR